MDAPSPLDGSRMPMRNTPSSIRPVGFVGTVEGVGVVVGVVAGGGDVHATIRTPSATIALKVRALKIRTPTIGLRRDHAPPRSLIVRQCR
jgi:hypothetical protein